MNEGDIVEQGNHDDLIAQDGFYAELYHSQFDKAPVVAGG
jgi:ATP-binding cassette subfamily B protein